MSCHFHAEQWLPYPVETVFAFFGNPDNLPRLMSPWQQARIETSALQPPPGTTPRNLAGDASTMTLTFRPFPFSPIRLRWDALIDGFAWNRQFCDTQTRGPFAFWHHCHRVSPAPNPSTNAPGSLLRDDVDFTLPLDPLSRVALPLVRLQIASMFRFRQRRTLELLAEFTPGL